MKQQLSAASFRAIRLIACVFAFSPTLPVVRFSVFFRFHQLKFAPETICGEVIARELSKDWRSD